MCFLDDFTMTDLDTARKCNAKLTRVALKLPSPGVSFVFETNGSDVAVRLQRPLR